MELNPYIDNNGENYVYFSSIPNNCKSQPCILGIDEAGRGPVLGPMVYGISFCPLEKDEDLKNLGVDDSKALTEQKREELLKKLQDNSDYIGYAIHVLSPRYISKSMYRRFKYNLNTMSHDTAINLVKSAIDKGVQVAEIYVDTVGPPEKYQAKLQEIFPTQKVTVAKKADSLYPCVSAASICAKVARDKCLKNWIFSENQDDCEITSQWGSGYPGDAVTKKFLRDNLDVVFGFPSIVRFSWKTAETLIEDKCVKVEFEEVDPEEDKRVKKNPSVKNFLAQTSFTNKENRNPKSSSRCKLVKDRNIESVSLASFFKK